MTLLGAKTTDQFFGESRKQIRARLYSCELLLFYLDVETNDPNGCRTRLSSFRDANGNKNDSYDRLSGMPQRIESSW